MAVGEYTVGYIVQIVIQRVKMRYSFLLFIFSSLLSFGCNAKDMIIQGAVNSYNIPSEYIRKNRVVFGGGDDSSKSTSFIIRNDLLIKLFPSESKKFIISGLIFWDKNYQQNGGLSAVAKRGYKLEKLKKVGVSEGLHIYKPANNPRYQYYYSFDINNGLAKTEKGFYIQRGLDVKGEKPRVIAGKILPRPKSCTISFLHDGMSIELSPLQSNKGCDVSKLPKFMNIIKNNLKSWEIHK